MATFSLAHQLEHTPVSTRELLAAFSSASRSDLAGLPRGALAAVLAAAAREPNAPPFLILTADSQLSSRLEADLAFFAGAQGVLGFPALESSPFVEVAPDRRATMDRLATLFHLGDGQAFRFLVAPITALARKTPPRAALTRRNRKLRLLDRVDRQELIALLSEAGYLRVPLVEDPGTFAVRGALLDFYPPHADEPVRIELDDDLVSSIKSFSPDDQRTLRDLDQAELHPVREVLLGGAELERAREKVSELCDAASMPTSKRRQLLDDIGGGRAFIGLESYLPAFYEGLESLLDFVPQATRVIAIDPPALGCALLAQRDEADRDFHARKAQKAPTFELSDHFLSPEDIERALAGAPLTVVHSLAVHGALAEEETELFASLLPPKPHEILRAGGSDQQALVTELRGRRAQKAEASGDALAPLAARLRTWLDEGLHAIVSARTLVQAERIAGLLRSYDLPLDKPAAFDPALVRGAPKGRVQVVSGALEDGLVLPALALACVTEEEIFGSQKARRAARKQTERDKQRAFVQDLRELSVGDFVVHVDHGIGIYRGLSLGELPVTRMEALQGMKPKRVEVLVVEYAGGDRLFLPVTRLTAIEKLGSKEGASPKLDKLGGHTFSRTKARVRESVRKLADDLLALYALRSARERPPYPPRDRSYAELEARFQYEETPDQTRAIEEVMTDLDGTRPMDRLVCGDVGFGKTEVALRAAFRVAMTGKQVAVLCPTTVLAQQHLRTFEQRFADYPVKIAMLSRFVPAAQQTEVLARLKDGSCDMVIGTHRLLSKDVHFAQLGLLVVDEEQRFGVTHKERIKKLRTEVDVLTLTATPIPRTLHMAIGGLRELSLIATPPPDRRAVRTFVTRWDEQVLRDAVTRELSRGGQVFFIHNRIEGLHDRAARLAELVPKARIAVAHGKLREASLERIMAGFVDGEYDVLACTAIVENGLDIPRANTIIIDRADMFGLSQLHQLRGRVGRSKERAYCYLVAPPPSVISDDARTRIEALERFGQLGVGFQIASLDLELRGAGDLLGEEQSGNVAAVGFDLFVHMLHEAVAELRGQTLTEDVDPELTLDLEHFLPEEYVADVGVRLSLYKRLASAESEESVHELGAEMEDRFGKPPEPARELLRAMALKPALRSLRVLGCEGTASRVTLHFKDDTPLDAAALARLVESHKGYQLTPDMRLLARFPQNEPGSRDAVDRVRTVLDALRKALGTQDR